MSFFHCGWNCSRELRYGNKSRFQCFHSPKQIWILKLRWRLELNRRIVEIIGILELVIWSELWLKIETSVDLLFIPLLKLWHVDLLLPCNRLLLSTCSSLTERTQCCEVLRVPLSKIWPLEQKVTLFTKLWMQLQDLEPFITSMCWLTTVLKTLLTLRSPPLSRTLAATRASTYKFGSFTLISSVSRDYFWKSTDLEYKSSDYSRSIYNWEYTQL